MEFKGYILDRKNKQIVIGGDENDMEDEEEFIPYVFFLKMVALSPDCKSDTTIAVSEDGNDFVIATLRPGKLDQTRSDLILPTGTVLKLVKGDGPLHVTGYLQEADDNEYEGYDDDEESEGESEEESELNPGARLVYYQKSDEEDDSDDEDFVGEEDDEEDDDDEEEEEEEEVFNSRKRKKAIDVVKGAASTKKSYIGSAQERKDICENYLKSGGNMDVFFSHQMLSDVDDEKRYKKIISEEQKKGNLRKFTPEETRLITSQLMTEEVDLANVDDEDDEDEDEEDFDSDDSLEGFIVRDGEESDEDEEEEEEDDDEEEEEEDSEDEKPKKRSKPKSKKKGEDNEEIEELVERITASPNVPKKLSKFTNFCKHTLKLEDDNVIKELWARQNE